MTQKKSKRLLAVSEAINYTRNMNSSLKVIFTSLLYRRSSILQDIYFLCRICGFVLELIRTRV